MTSLKERLVVLSLTPLLVGSLGCRQAASVSVVSHPHQPASVVVELSGTAPNNLVANPDPVRVHRGDRIRWVNRIQGSSRVWEIDLKDGGPTYERWARPGAGDTAGAVVRLSVGYGEYKYAFSVLVRNQIVTVDPKIIVQE